MPGTPWRCRPAWGRALGEVGQAAAVPAPLWAVLTHRLGETVQSTVLYDARAWVFAHTRRRVGAGGGPAKGRSAGAAGPPACRRFARAVDSQQQAAEALRRARLEIASLQGKLARAQVMAPSVQLPEVVVHRAKPCAEPIGVRLRERTPDPLSAVAAASVPAAVPAPALPSGPGLAAQPIAAVDVAGRRVLRVGSIQHAAARYRGRTARLLGKVCTTRCEVPLEVN
jgi:hypothetical protein